MYISLTAIKQALHELEDHHIFYGTTFLVFKKGKLPVGETITFPIDSLEREFLKAYYKPKRSSTWYYRLFRSTYKDKHWLDAKFPGSGSQSTRTRGKIAAAFIHKSPQIWGWQNNYLSTLKSQLHEGKKIPAFYLAVWLYRERSWDTNATANDILNQFLREFFITEDEIVSLFDVSVPEIPSEILFQEAKVTWEDLETIIGSPPDAQPGEGGTLTYLHLQAVGPAQEIEFIPAERLNLITGDNGLGKTFLLDCAWWALTSQWPGLPAQPQFDRKSKRSTITFEISSKSRKPERKSISYDSGTGGWLFKERRPTMPGLLIYACVDGSFAIWDPERNLQSVVFSKDQVWQGFTRSAGVGGQSYSEGLLRDWINWQKAPEDAPFTIFRQILRRLSPADIGPLEPGTPLLIPPDVREIPTLVHPYGQIPITHAAAGVKRIVAIAYFIVWAWTEHQRLSEFHDKDPQRQMVILIDEIEAHLHPRWQRLILPSLLEVSKDLSSDLEIQFIVATHSPLVMASVEPYFKDSIDKLCHLNIIPRDLFGSDISFEELPFTRYGPADSWLMSDVFELPSTRSIQAEQVIEKAMDLQRQEKPSSSEIRGVSTELANLLAVDDEFWPLWKYFAQQHGVNL